MKRFRIIEKRSTAKEEIFVVETHIDAENLKAVRKHVKDNPKLFVDKKPVIKEN